MKNSIRTITTTIALTALLAGPAAAMVSKSNVTQDVLRAGGSGSNVFVNVENDVATITGYFETATDKTRAIQAAKANTGIDRVVDLTTLSN